MYDVLTIRLGSGAEAPDLALLGEVAARHGMSRSQWVRSLIARELKLLGHAPERQQNAELKTYAEARSDAAIFAAHLQFEQNHPSPRDAHLRPRAPRRPAVMRVRVSVSAEEAMALEASRLAYGMSIGQVATIIVRRWIGLNKSPPAGLFGSLSAIRAQIRSIGINVNQLTHAANKLVMDVRLRRQDELINHLSEIGAMKSALDGAFASISESMGLDREHWALPAVRPDESFDPLPHPALPRQFTDDDPP